MPDGILPRALLAGFGDWPGASGSVAPVGFDLAKRRHGCVLPFDSGTPDRFGALGSAGPAFTSMASIGEVAWLLVQRSRAIGSGSMFKFFHHCRSSPRVWSSRWCARQTGTVNSSLTLRPIARG